MKRVISAVLGIALIGVVIYFGIKSVRDDRFVLPYGLASALIAPLGISALGYSVRKEDATLKKLALVPEIDNLIEKAETEAEKINRLKKEKEDLIRYIGYEAKKSAKLERKRILEEDASRIIEEYQKVLVELSHIQAESPDMDKMSEEIKKLYEMQVAREKVIGNICPSGNIWSTLYSSVQVLTSAYMMPAEIVIDICGSIITIVAESVHKLFNKKKK